MSTARYPRWEDIEETENKEELERLKARVEEILRRGGREDDRLGDREAAVKEELERMKERIEEILRRGGREEDKRREHRNI